MVKLTEVRNSVSAIVNKQPLVAAFFGGTSGIGSHTARALAKYTGKAKKSIRIYIIGRKEQAAQSIIKDCEQFNANGEYKFVQAEDLSLMRCVDDVCGKIIAYEKEKGSEGRVDYLMLSQGGSIFLPRTDTKEGIDVTMSLMYYSRMRVLTNLVPLLVKSTLPAVVVSVFAAGMEGKIFPDDLSLRDPSHYSYSQARSHMCYMHILFMEALAAQRPSNVRLIHIYPGLVIGPQFLNPELPAWFRFVWRWFFVPIFGRFTMKPADSADRMLYLAGETYPPGPAISDEKSTVDTSKAVRPGVYSITWNCDSNYQTKAYAKIDKEAMRAKVWSHTTKAFEVIERGEVFTE